MSLTELDTFLRALKAANSEISLRALHPLSEDEHVAVGENPPMKNTEAAQSDPDVKNPSAAQLDPDVQLKRLGSRPKSMGFGFRRSKRADVLNTSKADDQETLPV